MVDTVEGLQRTLLISNASGPCVCSYVDIVEGNYNGGAPLHCLYTTFVC